jgi:hypothetical protein
MENFICNFCNKIFKNKTTLQTHQKTTKYCLEKQGIKNDEYKCEHCDKILTTQTRLITHINVCKVKDFNSKELQKYKDIIEEKDKELKHKELIIKKYEIKEKIQENTYKEKENKYKELLEEKDKKYNDLKNIFNDTNQTIAEIAKQPKTINNSNNSHNDNRIKTQNNTQKFDINDIKRINNVLESYLTPTVLAKGQKGVAEMLKEHLLKNEDGELIYECTDVSRQKFEFINQNGFIEPDPKAAKLIKSLSDANLYDVAHATGKKLWEKEDGTVNRDAQNVHILKVGEVLDIDNDSSKFRTHLANITYNKEKGTNIQA